MEKKGKIIAAAILTIAIFGIGAFAFLSGQSQATTITNTVSQTGTKLDLKNNNNQNWAHMDLVFQNAPMKDGTTKNIYIELWMKPGEHTSIDLSNMLGYGTDRLPTGTTLTALTWSGLFNPTAGGTGNLDLTLQGWSNTANPVNAPKYALTQNGMPIGALPSSITTNNAIIGTAPSDVEVTSDNDAIESLFTEITMTVDSDGNLIMTFNSGNLCNTIAHII